MGLRVMQYRAGMVGGSLSVRSNPPKGTCVLLSLATGARSPKASKGQPGDGVLEPKVFGRQSAEVAPIH
jgi:hypothetical protein